MSNLKHKFVKNISDLIRSKISETSLALKVKLVKNDSYDEFVRQMYKFLSHEITSFIQDKLHEWDICKINNRLDILVESYLRTIK